MKRKIVSMIRNMSQKSFVIDTVTKISPDVRKVKKRVPDLPRRIQIQTMTGCNYKCDFCPCKTITQPMGKMDIKMFTNILDQLGPGWDGLLMPFLQNEPFLDKRIPELVKLAREKLPKATIEIQTNGSLLTKELLESTLPYVNTLKVNDYTKDSRVIKKIKRFNIKSSKLLLDQRTPENEVLTNRAGNVKYVQMKHKKLPLKKFCIYPFKTAYITSEGKLIICCMDWHQSHVLGNLNKSSLKEAWHSENFRKLRNSLARSIRDHPLCAKCDFDGYSMGEFRRRYQSLYQLAEKILNTEL